MAATFSTALDIHCSIPHPNDTKRLIINNNNNKKSTIICYYSSKPPNSSKDPNDNNQQKNPSLSYQLKPLSTTLLSDNTRPENQTQLRTKPKSTWVNPTKPKPFALTLSRHKRSAYTRSPQIKDLRIFAKKLNSPEANTESAFLKILEENPNPPTRDDAVLLLNNLRTWQKTLVFFNWIKTQNLFPMETIFYNITMKSLRFGRQFQLVENLAFEMIDNGVELDNITYSTIITGAKRCNFLDKAVEWFERMYETGLKPDEVTYSAILDVYANLGKVEEVMNLYERGRASGWKPDSIAFAVLGKMFGQRGDYDGIKYVLQEMDSIGLKPNLSLYATLIDALGKAKNPGLARKLFEEMLESGIEPDERTLTALCKTYGKARWGEDALELWWRMKSKGWPMDFILYNTLLSMCADLGLEEEAEEIFEHMKGSANVKPDSWSYTAMLNIYASGGNVNKAMKVFDGMTERGVDLNVMGCTCLIQCLGRAKRIDDLVRVFELSVRSGVKPDDRLCGCLLSVISYCDNDKEVKKVLSCLVQANPKLVSFLNLIEEEETSFDTINEELKGILSDTEAESRRPFCNCLIDICRNKNLYERAHELLYMGTVYGLYPGLHTKTADEWRLNVRTLSVGAAHTAFEEWMGTVTRMISRDEPLPDLFSANTGAGTHKFSQGLANAFGSHMRKFGAPFRQSEEKAGFFLATIEELESWVESSAHALGV